MAFRVGAAVNAEDMIDQLDNFLTTTHTFSNILISGVGDGEFTAYSSIDDTITEDWVITCSVVGPSATFTVEGAISGFQADATSGVAYDNGIISFTITDGTADWAVSDVITFDVIRNMGTETLYEITRNAIGSPISYTKTNNNETWDVDVRDTTNGKLRSCDDPFGTKTGMHFINASIWVDSPDWSGSAWTEDSWDSLPTSWSVSVWVKDLLSYGNPTIALFSGWEDFSVDKQVLNVTGTETTLIVNGNSYAADLRSNVWQLVTITADGANITTYLNDTQIGQFANTTIKPLIAAFGPEDFYHYAYSGYWTDRHCMLVGKLADFVVWNSTLTLTDVQDIYNNALAIDKDLVEVIWKLEVNPGSVTNGTTYRHTTSNGGSQQLKVEYLPDGDNSTLVCTTSPNYMSPIGGYSMEDYTIGIHLATYTQYFPITYYLNDLEHSNNLAIGGVTQTIPKFWFVASDDRIIISYKLFDETNPTQPNPVYITGYFGLTDNFTQCNFGTSKDPVSWTNQTSSLGIGVTSNAYGDLFAVDTAWGVYNVDHGDGDWANLDSSTNNIYLRPIEYYQSSGNSQHFGSPTGVYKINPANVIAEDIVTIDTDTFVVLQDTFRNSFDDFIAIKLQ